MAPQSPASPLPSLAAPAPGNATPKPGSNHSKSGLSDGAVAGIAVGCFFAGVAIAGLIFFMLSRRRNTKRPGIGQQQHLPNQGRRGVEKGAVVTGAPAGRTVSKIDSLLPQPVEDDAITKEVSKLRDNIKNHARSYYHPDAVPATAVNESALRGLATATGIQSSALRDALVAPSTRTSVIRLFIAWNILSRCVPDQGGPSLLPKELARLASGMSGQQGGNIHQTALFSKWKTITGALLQQSFGGAIGESDPRAESVREAIMELDAILRPFFAPGDAAQRHRNLEMIVGRAAQLSFLLFSQPGSFHFDFAGPNDLIIFPALLQTVSDAAQPIRPPRVLWEKEETHGH